MFPQIRFFYFQIPTFYVVISLSLTALLFWLSQRLDTERSQIFDRKIAYNLSLILMFAGFLGGRSFHVFYEEWPFYKEFPEQILKFWNGGFVYFGGFIFALIAAAIYLKNKKPNFSKWADFMTPLFAASYALGRIGCFLEGCCFGRYCELPWAIDGRHPTQLYMSLAEFFILGLILAIEKIKPMFDGYLFAKWILLHSIFRFIFEYFRDDDRGNLIYGLSISQLLCIIFIFISSLFLIRKSILEPKNQH